MARNLSANEFGPLMPLNSGPFLSSIDTGAHAPSRPASNQVAFSSAGEVLGAAGFFAGTLAACAAAAAMGKPKIVVTVTIAVKSLIAAIDFITDLKAKF
jgi:hypothetical protein